MAEVNIIDWHITPARAERWHELWAPAVERSSAFGAIAWMLIRSTEDPLHFRQISLWNEKSAFEAYWYSDEIGRVREAALQLYHKPVLPVWNKLIDSSGVAALEQAAS